MRTFPTRLWALGTGPAPRALRLAVALGCAVTALCFVLCFATAVPARAEDDDAALRQKLQEQIEKILQLMKENEAALLRVSTGLAGAPTKPEVDLPAPEGAETPAPKPPQGEPEKERTPEEESARRAEIARRIKALVEGQRQASREIPGALAELIRLLPQSEGSSQQPQDKEPKPGEAPRPEDQEARDARKKLEEEQRLREEEARRKEGKEPKSPRDPNDRTREDPAETPEGGGREVSVPWLAGLPPEIRDAFANGDFGSVPARYRDLVRRYVTWLTRQASAGERR